MLADVRINWWCLVAIEDFMVNQYDAGEHEHRVCAHACWGRGAAEMAGPYSSETAESLGLPIKETAQWVANASVPRAFPFSSYGGALDDDPILF